jgi:hypothetical protein
LFKLGPMKEHTMTSRILSIKYLIIFSTLSIWLVAFICMVEYVKTSQRILDDEIQLKKLEFEYNRLLKEHELKEEALKEEEFYEKIIDTKIQPTLRPGEYGVPYVLDETKLDPVQKLAFDEGWKNYQFNSYLSDMISIERELDDLRDDA